jgi:DNA-binding response OmpR family regulator
MKTPTDTSFEFTVLLVEDDDNFRKQLAQYLSGEGFRIAEANSSSQACALIRKRKVSLVLLDWDLQNHNPRPEESSTGLEILRTCHEVDALLPAIVMSSAPGLDVRTDSLLSGADCFLQKPFAFPALTTLLRRWIESNGAAPDVARG